MNKETHIEITTGANVAILDEFFKDMQSILYTRWPLRVQLKKILERSI
jgi:hypothetical protein